MIKRVAISIVVAMMLTTFCHARRCGRGGCGSCGSSGCGYSTYQPAYRTVADAMVVEAAPTVEVPVEAVVKTVSSKTGYGLFGANSELVKVDKQGGPIALVYWGAKWCNPCRKIKPFMQQIADEGYRVQIGDLDDHADLAASWGINSVPTLLLNQNGKELWRHEGGFSEKFARDILENFKIKKIRRATPRTQTYTDSNYYSRLNSYYANGGCNCAMCRSIRAGTWRW